MPCHIPCIPGCLGSRPNSLRGADCLLSTRSVDSLAPASIVLLAMSAINSNGMSRPLENAACVLGLLVSTIVMTIAVMGRHDIAAVRAVLWACRSHTMITTKTTNNDE